jgi:hypothetical protein
MDLNAIKSRLESMTKNSSSNDENRVKVKRFKPAIGKQTIRVVPFKYNKDYPFTEIKFYYNIGKFKVIASPSNWNEKDPILEFAKQLRGTNDKENWKLAKKLDPKTRITLPVIVRGEEHEGVQYWEFGKTTHEEFLQLAADEEVGDFTDILNGRDIKLVTVGPDVTGTKYNRTTISPSMKQSPLSKSKDEIEKWLEDQINPLDAYKCLPFDTLKQALSEWLSPTEDEEEITSEPASNFEDDFIGSTQTQSKSNYKLPTPSAKKTKLDSFEDLFGDDETE